MNDDSLQHANLPLARLAIPMLLENMLRASFAGVDVFMLSFYSQTAVAAVGLCNNITFFIVLLFSMVSTGTSVILAQYLGAGLEEELEHTNLASFVLAIGFALILSLMIVYGTPLLLSCYALEAEVSKYAGQYMFIYGAGSVFVAFNVVQGTILRAYGYPRDAMFSNLLANICNIIGNSLALFGPFGLPVTGVPGVALSTVISQGLACVFLAYLMKKHKSICIPWRRLSKVPGKTYARLLAIGVPTAGENVSYAISQNLIAWIIAHFGTAALAANTYVVTLTRFVCMPALSIGNAGQIKTGYLVGARRPDEAYHNVYRYSRIGLVISLSASILLYLCCKPLLMLFTREPGIITLASTLLLICIAREIGRIPNVTVIPALKGAGDVFFPVLVGMIFMWGVGVGGAYFFGIALSWGLAGVWLAIAADEWVRGILMLFRWKSGIWRSKSIVSKIVTSQ